MVIGHLDLLFCEVQVLPSFMMGFLLFFFLIPRSSFYILNTSPLLDISITKIMYSVACFIFLHFPVYFIDRFASSQTKRF